MAKTCAEIADKILTDAQNMPPDEIKDFVEMLLCFKALQLNAKDKQGLTPLAWAEGKHSGMKADRKMIGLLKGNGAM